MIFGYLIFHPYTMLVYALLRIHEQGGHIGLNALKAEAVMAFKPAMLPMSISFVLFGGIMGLLVGSIIDKQRKLIYTQHEHEKSKIGLETLNELMVTLSHYLLNANMVIGGKVRRCRKVMSSEDILPHLKVIEDQARRIDAVIGSLRELTEIRTTLYSTGGQTKMIDITKEIEAHLRQMNKSHKETQRTQD
jgi:signal transduction histidine kinase